MAHIKFEPRPRIQIQPRDNRVSNRTLLRRINRKLRKQPSPQMVRWLHPTHQDYNELGPYFLLNINQNTIAAKWVDLLALGRELGCITTSDEYAPID